MMEKKRFLFTTFKRMMSSDCCIGLGQVEAMTDELTRRREECIQLRTVLASAASTAPVQFNDEGELEMAYKSQKDLNMSVIVTRIVIITIIDLMPVSMANHIFGGAKACNAYYKFYVIYLICSFYFLLILFL